MTTLYEDYLKTLEEKDWHITRDLPMFEPGKRHDPVKFHDYEYLDFCDKLMGRPYGANGIGKLREVALVWPTEHEIHPYWSQAPEFFHSRWARWGAGKPDIDGMVRQHQEYARILEENGVQVHWIKLPSHVGPMGPLHKPSGAASDLFVVRGGVIVGKWAANPINNGRAALFARWASIELGIPTLLTIHGKGVAEIATSVWLAEDVFVTALSASFNQEGLDQFIPVVKASSKEDVHVHVMKLPGDRFWDWDTGECAHPDIVIGALDLGKVILYPPGVDFETHKWLRNNKFDIVEVDTEEQIDCSPCNIITLEPGKVMMPAQARRAIAKVRALGVEVVEVEREGFNLDCGTAKLRRDPGPSFFKDR